MLRERLKSYLREAHLEPGDPFLTDAELVDRSKLSRSTVRRAMDTLQREGWVQREIGRGTYVGPRVRTDAQRPESSRTTPARPGMVQLGVVVFWRDSILSDWYTPQVLRGIDERADANSVVVQLIGHRDHDIDAVSHRLERAKPDVLACLAGNSDQIFLIRDAMRMNIPVLVTGTQFGDLPIPSIQEDNRQGVNLAVNHLVEQGHERIGLVLPTFPAQWVFDRFQGYEHALSHHGIEPVSSLTHWVDVSPEGSAAQRQAGALEKYLDQRRPTALILGNRGVTELMREVINCHQLRVPNELSLVSFDQSSDGQVAMDGVPLTTVTIPLRQMGRELARLARNATEGVDPPPCTKLNCDLVEGRSVAPPVG